VDGVLVAHSVADAVETARTVDDEVFVVGGAEVYAAALPLTDRLALTFVDAEPEGDTFFPAVDWREWREVRRVDGDGIAFVTYERATPSWPSTGAAGRGPVASPR
jgi:dihydrofolate reductase